MVRRFARRAGIGQRAAGALLDGDAVGAALHRELGLFSRFDRDLGLADALLAHGREQAGRYLALRSQSSALWEALALQVGVMGARLGRRMAQALRFLPGPGHFAAPRWRRT